MITAIWLRIGFNMVILLAAISSIPAELLDAARIDGAGRLRILWSMVVPLEVDPDKMFRIAGNAIIEKGMGTKGDHILIVGSLPMMKVAGKTSLLHIRRLGS